MPEANAYHAEQQLDLPSKAVQAAKVRAMHQKAVKDTRAAAENKEREKTPEIGQLTKEGIYIGRLKDKDGVEKDWFADVTDAQDSKGNRLSLDFNAAAKFAKNAHSLGHADWIVPPGWDDGDGKPNVLNALLKNKNTGEFEGTFDETGSHTSGWYWSSSPISSDSGFAKLQRFSDGHQNGNPKSYGLSVRPVRSLAI